MDDTWIADGNSMWVIAPSDDVVGEEGERTLLNHDSVFKLDTTNGTGVPLFTDDQWAERFISDGSLELNG